MFYLYYRLGLQSNLILAAKYASPDRKTLPRSTVVAAVSAVIEAQPRLRYVSLPQQRGKATHLQVGILNKVDVDRCVEYMDDDGQGVTADLLETLHNRWFDEWVADRPETPAWKVVVKGTDVLFVFSHAVCDGRSGYIFHREFLAALNSLSSSGKQLAEASAVVYANEDAAKAGALRLAPLLVLPKPSIATLLWRMLKLWILGLVHGNKRANYDFPRSKPYFSSLAGLPTSEERTLTSVSLRRIPAAHASQIVAACRENKTTLTPLLSVLYIATMAVDCYPTATLATAAVPYDMRPFLPMDRIGAGVSPRGAGVIFNGAGGSAGPMRLKAVKTLFGSQEVDAAAVWAFVRQFKEGLSERIVGQSQRTFVAPTLLGNTLDDVINKAFPEMKQADTLLVSNLGPFVPVKEEEKQDDEQWSVTDVQFSVSPTNGRIGSQGPILSVAGVSHGDLIINATYEPDVVKRDIVEALLDSLVKRLYHITGVAT
jgi:hypothetical protein